MDRTMLRIGAMNMMTHGIDNPFIEYRDSLSDQNGDKDKYTLILANPPFKGSLDAESVSGDLLKVCKTKKTELLFLVLFLRMLKIGGRCACIVPDGVLFGSSTAHKAIRKEIVENQRLEAVVSMPSGVFKPYAGVSTAILIFTKTEHGGTDHVWFYDMKADGFSLDDKRTPVAENDIPDIIERFKNREKEVDRKRIKEYVSTHPSASYYEGSVWDGVTCDVALPCATQNEINEQQAQKLVAGGCYAVAEGANMPTNAAATEVFLKNKVLFLPGKASNAGGVATSALEMGQNSIRSSWTFEEVDAKLQGIMVNIYQNMKEACEKYDAEDNFVVGANIAGFMKVADAMMAQGVV